VPIRILSPGSNGSVNQSNNSNANSDATNNNGTTQTISQDPTRLLERFDASPIQAAGQLAGNRQEALSEAISRQFDPTNLDLPVRIFSPGENGSVSQSNNSNANSDSTNNNDTTQSVMQALDEGLLRL
jgi:hypothetical protein